MIDIFLREVRVGMELTKIIRVLFPIQVIRRIPLIYPFPSGSIPINEFSPFLLNLLPRYRSILLYSLLIPVFL